MKRLLLISAGVLAAGGIAATPAIAGLSGNPSFSHQIPVRVPTQARAPQLVDDHGTDVTSPATHPATRSPEPGDDRGGQTRHVEPGDDRGSASGREPEPGDDRGGASSSTEPGDDRGDGSSSSDNSGPGSSDSDNSGPGSSGSGSGGSGRGGSGGHGGGSDDGGSHG